VHNIECLTTQPRKKRLYGSVEGLGSRLALLESLVHGLLPEADVHNPDDLRQLGSALGIPLPDSRFNDGSGEQKDTGHGAADDSVSLLPDQQGQVQYIGPGSSFSFHVKLRTLVGRGAPREFVLFGRNAAAQETHHGSDGPRDFLNPTATTIPNPHSHVQPGAHDGFLTASQVPNIELLIRVFFERIHADYPVLHEPSFREAYQAWLVNPANADPAWLCSFYCVLLLTRRVARMPSEEQERLWWQRVQALLPVVIFTSSITAVQAIMLAAVHLHHTNHRDACWNLTGTAIRIAHAIGLHQDKVSAGQTPLARELRKLLWWTLYAFEKLQVSSYDRPSGIEHSGTRISCPNEKVLGGPPDLFAWSTRLWVHLASTCRAPKTIRSHASEESYVGPLSPAAGVLRDLERWKETLPQHLRFEAIDASAPVYQRQLLILHCVYHYTVIVLCRSALLARASILTKNGQDSPNSALTAMADACSESGRDLAQVLLRIETLGKFDPIIGIDVWYALTASSVLVLDLVCLNKLGGADMSESRILLSQLADLAQRHRRNPFMPGTIEKFASLIPELHSMADSLASPVRFAEPKVEITDSSSLPPPQQLEAVPQLYHQSPPTTGAYMFADDMSGRIYHPDQAYTGQETLQTGGRSFDRTTQMQFMDFTMNNVQDWNWSDIGNLLGGEGGQTS
jgi:hypothetical protein